MYDLPMRPRRNRRNEAMRALMRENYLSAGDLIAPLFVIDGTDRSESIEAMPGQSRLSIDLLVAKCCDLFDVGIGAVALFPALDSELKDSVATESTNPHGLLPRTVQAIKKALPEMLVITDVAMDPYSSDGHDGFVKDEQIINDTTLEILAKMAVAQAEAGADIVAPSDMMDGRIGIIRDSLDEAGFTDVGIISYAAKYASAFYGPFREALDSTPSFGDKKTYQMDPANSIEALREVELDIDQGADVIMIKPGLPYLDVIKAVKDHITLPVCAYQVSGEYSMIKAAAEKEWVDEQKVMLESLICFKRAGADMIFTYFAEDAARALQK